MTLVDVSQGDGPVILGIPHAGTWLPDDVISRLTPRGRLLADTDWHVDRLYDGLLDGATVVRANFHRYLIDANRGPADESLYPGQNTTGLVPATDFDGEPIWLEGEAPDADEVRDRLAKYHAPYHTALESEISRIKARHGVAILYDCHSIRSHIPFLFKGRLPDLNIGTVGGVTCDPKIETRAMEICAAAEGFSCVLNGRFQGGWTTRHYGAPESGVHAIQMELAQATHLKDETPPFAYDPDLAEGLRALLSKLLNDIAALAPTLNR